MRLRKITHKEELIQYLKDQGIYYTNIKVKEYRTRDKLSLYRINEIRHIHQVKIIKTLDSYENTTTKAIVIISIPKDSDYKI